MFQKALKDLLGDEIIARYGCIGAVDDLCFDGDCRQLRYLLLAVGAARRASRPLVNVSRTRVECGSGVWPARAGRMADLLVPLDRVGPMDRAQRAVHLRRTREDLRSPPSL